MHRNDLLLHCKAQNLGMKQQACLTPASPLGLLQPAAAFVQAACCQTTRLKLAMIQTNNPQQAVDWKSAAGCSSPTMQLAVFAPFWGLYSGLVERSENANDGFGSQLQKSTNDQQFSLAGTACIGCVTTQQEAHLSMACWISERCFRGGCLYLRHTLTLWKCHPVYRH
jgi:hypothetical protein